MADDNWEAPDAHYQILMLGGFVHDISEMQFQLLKDEIHSDHLIQVEDIYGSDCMIRPSHITSIRQWNRILGDRFRRAHPDD